MTEQKKASDILSKDDPALKALYVLLLRVNQLAANNGFILVSLIDALDKKGIINRAEIDKAAKEQGLSVLQQMELTVNKLETEVFGQNIHDQMNEE